jgi:circadian clock protein KaiC
MKMSAQITQTAEAGLQKALTGIQGFDEMTLGGLPRRRTSLIMGGTGSGKTIFALQTLVNGARKFGEPAIFVAFEENAQQIIANATSFGWDLPALQQDKLFFLDARLSVDVIQAGDFDLSGMLASLQDKAAEIGARRIAFDSIDVLLMLMGNIRAKHRELYRLRNWLAESDLIGVITTRLENEAEMQHYGFLQFMADCVIHLDHQMTERISGREIRVVKYRGSSFSENAVPMVIGPHGIEVANIDPSHIEYEVFTEQISSGVGRLDTMLNGGYYRGNGILITGSPGTAKSSLCAAFIQAACSRGERAIYISFDESADEIVRNMASIGVLLAPYIEAGLLRMHSARAEGRSAEEHLLRLRNLIDEHQPRCMVIDPLSAMIKAGGPVSAIGVAKQLLFLTKSKGITLLCSSLLESSAGAVEGTELQVSTIADTWIQLSYLVQGGERNRALTIIKSRGTKHSNQVRELILSEKGITLADVYVAGGNVLMGTLRWEKEQTEAAEQEQRRQQAEVRQRELQLAEAEIRARMATLTKELELQQSELARLAESQARDSQRATTNLKDLNLLRGADQEQQP